MDGFDVWLVFIEGIIGYFIVFGDGVGYDFFIEVCCIWMVFEELC